MGTAAVFAKHAGTARLSILGLVPEDGERENILKNLQAVIHAA